MVEVVFDMNQSITAIQAKSEDTFQSIIDKFIQKTLIAPNSVYYIANAKPVDPQNTVESQMSTLNKQNKKITVLVNSVDSFEQDKEQVIVQSKDIICPECKEPCLFAVENCKIKLFNCINNHTTSGIKFIDFNKTQEINISEIVCGICQFKNKGNSHNHEFYLCLTCKKNVCLLCKSKHASNHNIIKYDLKNYICPKHNDNFIKYCEKCRSNICFSCKTEHAQHETINFVDLNIDIEQSKKTLDEIKSEMGILTNKINEIINTLNEFIKEINLYYEINKNILENYEIKNRNYQVLKNINEINDNNEIFERLKNINKTTDIADKIKEIIDLHIDIKKDINSVDNKENKEENKEEKENKENNIVSFKTIEGKYNQMTMIYNVKNLKKIRIYGNKFVKNNKSNCYLVIGEEKKELCEYLELNNNEKDTLEIKLIEIKPITNMSYLFYECNSLIILKDISNWDTKNVTNMSCMFYNCTSLIALKEISDWNTKNVTDMSYLFSSCRALKSLPDISYWNVKNVTDMSYMFSDCCSLKSLPDLSRWKVNKNLDKENMFDGVDKKIIPKKFKGCLIY